MTNLASVILNNVGSIRQVFEAKQDIARYLMIASGAPDKIGTAVQARTP